MQLFDQQFIDALPEFSEYQDNSLVVSILRRADPSMMALREQMEAWFSRLPDGAKIRLRQSLQSLDDKFSFPAFWELLWHEGMIANLNVREVLYEPNMNGTTPDFLVTMTDGSKFVVELFTPFDPLVWQNRDRSMAQFEDRLARRLGSQFVYSLSYNRWLPTGYQDGAVLREITKWGMTLPADDKRYENTFFKQQECGVRVGLTRLKEETTKGRARRSARVGLLTNLHILGNKTKDAIRAKCAKYKEFGLPLMVVACDATTMKVNETQMRDVLFGTSTINFKQQEDGSFASAPEFGHRFDGIFNTPRDGKIRAQYLGAVGYCSWKFSGEKNEFPLDVYHNPFTIKAIPVEAFIGHRQYMRVEEHDTHFRMGWNQESRKSIV